MTINLLAQKQENENRMSSPNEYFKWALHQTGDLEKALQKTYDFIEEVCYIAYETQKEIMLSQWTERKNY